MKHSLTLLIGIVSGLILSIWIPVPMAQHQIRKERKLELSRLESLIQSQFTALPERFSLQVERLFPLNLQGIEGNLQLTTKALPTALNRFLQHLETIAPENIPTQQELTLWRKEISEAVNILQPMHRDTFANQIALAEWALNALDLLSHDNAKADPLVDLILARTIMDQPPANAPEKLFSAVSTRTDHLLKYASRQIQDELKSNTPADLPTLRSLVLISNWMRQEGILEDSSMADSLSVRLELEEWKFKREQLLGSGKHSGSDFELATIRLLEEGAEIIESAAIQGITIPHAFTLQQQQLAGEISANQRELLDRQNADYQLWAISQIQAANEMIGAKGSNNISNWLNEAKTKPWGKNLALLPYLQDQSPKFRTQILNTVYEWKKGNLVSDEGEIATDEATAAEGTDTRHTVWSPSYPADFDASVKAIIEAHDRGFGWRNKGDLTKALTADALIVRLMVIDESYLDRPVAALYSESFQAAWSHLEGSELRTQVAKECAVIPKKKPGDPL